MGNEPDFGSARRSEDRGGGMRRPDRVDLFLTFQTALVLGFLGVVVFGVGDWAGAWS